MSTTRLLKLIGLLIATITISTLLLTQNERGRTQNASSLVPFLQRLLETRDPAALPSFQELLKVQDEIPSASPEQISGTLPLLFLSLKNPDIKVQIYGAALLWSIANRPDGRKFLEPHLQDIAGLFDSPDARLQTAASVIFMMLKPPPPAAVPLVVAFLRRTDRDTRAQASAVGFLDRYASEDRDAVEAIKLFLARPLDPGGRVQALNALNSSSKKDSGIVDRVIASLDDPDQGVRFTAAQVISGLGQEALLQAQPALERMAERPDELDQTKAFAREALKALKRSK